MAKSKRTPSAQSTSAQAPVEQAPALPTEPQGAPPTAAAQPSAGGKRPGMFENAASWLLARLPWFKDRYEHWGVAKRVIIALVLYIIILPVIPIVVAVIMYLHDPEGFKKSKALPILGAIIVAQLGLFGIIAVQPPQVSDTNSSNAVSTSPGVKSGKATPVPASKPSLGRTFNTCDDAFKAGVHNIARTDPSYRSELDRDNDGVACER